jgi:hypothetical protein
MMAQCKSIFLFSVPPPPNIQNSTALFKSFQAQAACPSGKTDIKMKMSMRRRWNDTYRQGRSTRI